MNAKLHNVTTQYRKFNQNQVLTDGQLNEFIDYFEDQDRLSRTRLSGVGIVCGFKSIFLDPELDPNNLIKQIDVEESFEVDKFLNTLIISQGSGVTTDGDIITLRKRGNEKHEVNINFKTNSYKYFRKYNDQLRYDHFVLSGSTIPLLEIISEEEYFYLQSIGEEVEDFLKIETIKEELKDKVIILYLESYSNEESPCQDVDCDNIGSEQVSNLKVLLADAISLEDIFSKNDPKDTIFKRQLDYEILYDKLPNIEAKRAILNSNVVSPLLLKSLFEKAIDSLSDLSIGFEDIAVHFNISTKFGNLSLLEKLQLQLSSNWNVSPSYIGYQYQYDFYKDLVDTYNEIKGLIYQLNVDCCPDISSFPKHLMLGAVGTTLELGEIPVFRHSFYHSPITTNYDENYERVMMLINRFLQKINNFKFHNGPVKIIPSNLYARLGYKAVPFYYNVDNALLSKWNFERTKIDRANYNLSYHTNYLANEDVVKDPLSYNIDYYDFYRIEGHVGMPYQSAYQAINDIKVEYGLAFDVVVLLLEKDELIEISLPNKEINFSFDTLRNEVSFITKSISTGKIDSIAALTSLTKIDTDLKLLNKLDFPTKIPLNDNTVVIQPQNPKKKEVTTELLKEFLERKSGLEHLAGVWCGGTFVLVCKSEKENAVLADFALPYLCCSKDKINIPPIANNDKVTCLLGRSVTIAVMNNDYDADNDALTVIRKSKASYGEVTLSKNGVFTYIHDGSPNLRDSFTYCLNDGKEDSNIATVYIEIKSPPIALNDIIDVERGGSINIPVKSNDYSLEKKPLTVHIKTHPTLGTATVNEDGTINYRNTGGIGFSRTDSFTYYVNDGELSSNEAQVRINIMLSKCNVGMDVVFVYDYSPDIAEKIEEFQTGVPSIIDTIKDQTKTSTYRLGVVVAEKYNTGIEAQASQRIIGSKTLANQWITTMETMSENNELSFSRQVNKLKNLDSIQSVDNRFAISQSTDMVLTKVIKNNIAGAFREEAAKYVILITENNDDLDAANPINVEEIERLKDDCIANSIKVIVVGNGVEKNINGKEIWKELAIDTGGSWSNQSTINTIQTAISDACTE